MALVWSKLEGCWHVASNLGMAMSRDKAEAAKVASDCVLGARVIGAGEGGVLTSHGSTGAHVGRSARRAWGRSSAEGLDLGIVRLVNRDPSHGASEA